MKKYIASVEAPDDWEPKFGEESVDFFFKTGTGDSDIISTEMIEVKELPKEVVKDD